LRNFRPAPFTKTMQITRRQPFIFEDVDPLLKLSEVEKVLRASRIFYTVPSRPTLIGYCEDGTLESLFWRGQHLVYESSLRKFIESFKRPTAKAA
jgi:hypothetical protein